MKISHFKKSMVAVALATALVACGDKEQAGAQQMPPMNVSTISVTTQEARIFNTLPGRINAIKDAEVRARVDGIVQSINFEQGSTVKEGQLLFKIDPAVYQANVNAAQASLQQAEATARSAAAQAKRYEALIKSNAISRQEYDNAVAAAQQSAASVEAAKAALASANISLSYTDVTSPVDGIIGEALVTEGALVSASGATQLAKVQQLDLVYADFTQSTSEMAALRKAFLSGELARVDENSAEITLVMEDGSEYEHKGKLLFSGVSVDANTSKVNLRATFPNPDHLLLPGMYIQVKLERGLNKNAVLVPSQAIQRNINGTSSVYVVEDGKVVSKLVTVGDRINQNVIITSGLQAGEQLIVEGFSKIGAGMPVKALPWSKDPNATPSATADQAGQ